MGYQDPAIALSLSAALSDFVQSGNVSNITLNGIPEDVSLSAGTNNHDGSWTISTADIVGLTLTPTTDTDFTITLSADATAVNGADINLQGNLYINVEPPLVT